MKKNWLLVAIIASCSPGSWAIYGPSLARADTEVAMRACREARFSQGQEITEAMQTGKPEDILRVLGHALKEWKATPKTSALYPARAFCIHELVPSSLPREGEIASPASWQPTAAVKAFKDLGIEYFYYDPDAQWTLREDPVDLNQLSGEYLDSPWGRKSFLMMTTLGWSKGACQEGPDQFREVIRRSESFLKEYPRSEVSDQIRLELANAYATWWNVSQIKPGDGGPDNPENYIAGSREARRQAINLYQEYLSVQHSDEKDVRRRLRSLQGDPNGKKDYDYWCPDYED